MPVAWWVWVAFVGFILALLALDLLVFHRRAHAVSMREAASWCAVWVGLGLLFGALLWVWQGATAAGEYLAGYLIEYSLSVDNVFVFALIFTYFAVPAAYQHRVLFWGVVGAIVFRAIFIVAGAALLERFHWLIYVFGGLLLVTGVKLALNRDAEVHPEQNVVLRLARRLMPLTPDYYGQRFFIRQAGRLLATPLFAVLLVVETTDIVFAIDSIPAIFAVTGDPFLIFTSNAFAILGLRTLYFLLAGMMGRFAYLKVGLGAVLVLAGAKMVMTDIYKVPIWPALAAIAAILAVAVVASLRVRPQEARSSRPTVPGQAEARGALAPAAGERR